MVNATFVGDAWFVARRDLKFTCAAPERERMGAVVNQAYKVRTDFALRKEAVVRFWSLWPSLACIFTKRTQL